MSIKNNRKLILSGILLVVSTVCYLLYNIVGRSNPNVLNIIFTVVCAGVLISYCFIFNRTKLNRIVYYISLGLFAFLKAYFCVKRNYFNNCLFLLYSVLFLAIIAIMIIVKTKSSTELSIAGTVIFGVYAVVQIIILAGWIIIPFGFYINFYLLMFVAYTVMEFIAFLNIWLAEGGNISIKNKVTKNKAPIIVKTSPEDDLISLKQLYESGAIDEREYNQKKAEILNKF